MKMTGNDWITLSDKYVMNTYKRFPLVISRGAGTRVWDADGREYIDFTAGIAVCSLGHCHPKVVRAIQEQAERLSHISNLYHIEPQISLAKLLVENSFADKVFFCNSGAEANEAAIKLARKHGNEKLGGRNELITMRQSFHGRTLATITATGQEKFQAGFAPLPEGFKYVPFNDVHALEGAITDRTCGVLVEPVQAEGGVCVPDAGYLKAVREVCDKRGILLLLDEVQTGMGRTGTLFAYEQSGIRPDIATLAKALGNGFPVGAMLTTDSVAEAFAPGNHASTFGGNPLAMAACLATLETLLADGIVQRCLKTGDYFLEKLGKLKEKHAAVKDVRGKGLLLGLEMDGDVADIVRKCMERGFLVISAGTNVLRFVPPLIISEEEIDRLVAALDDIMGEK